MEKYFDEIVKSIQGVISFNSCLAPAKAGAPFGEENGKCLEFFLSLARDMGFETKNFDGYAGEVIFGEGEEFAVLAHLDVVPAGSGWTYPPFDGVIADGKLYGRGAMDDKGPAVICLYCLKALKEEGFLPKRKIKLIVGCNEESGWKCMEYYKKVARLPDEGFTPDADFPVIYAEKGILQLRLSFSLKNPPFEKLYGGTAANMVCDFACAAPFNECINEYANPVKDTLLRAENGLLKAFGISAHASTPEKGANALQALLAFYAKTNDECAQVYDILFNDKLKLKEICDETGSLTLSPNLVEYKNGVLSVTVDLRVPATHALKEPTHALNQAGISYEIIHGQEPLYNAPNGKLIQTLLGVYNRVTGENKAPVAIGGGTYARVLKCGCGFGPAFVGDEVTIHQANEYIALDKIRLLSEIYYATLKEICK